MRVAVGNVIRVQPGDRVVIQARLRAPARLGRLYVFSKARGDPDFSPHVPRLDVVEEKPQIQTPTSLRLVGEVRPEQQIEFIADLDGFVQVVQEVDTVRDIVAKVKLKRHIDPELPWKSRVFRKLSGVLAWNY